MLPLLQKRDQSQASVLAAWHANFRKLEQLPDTKVVRTQFFINFASLAVAAGLLLYFCYQEYTIRNFNRQMADRQTQIDTDRKASDQALALFKKFTEEEKKIDNLNNFLKPRVVLSQFLLQLGNSLPPELAMDAVDIRNTGVELRGMASGSPEEASGRASAYVEQLKQDKYFGDIFEKNIKQDVKRDQSSGQITFNLSLTFKGAARK
jgi:hypothetical protein